MHDAQRERLLQKEVVLVHHNPFFTNHPLPFHETILNSPHFPIMGKFRKLNPPLHKEREGGGGSNYADTLSFSEKRNYCILQGGKKEFTSANPLYYCF